MCVRGPAVDLLLRDDLSLSVALNVSSYGLRLEGPDPPIECVGRARARIRPAGLNAAARKVLGLGYPRRTGKNGLIAGVLRDE